MRIVLITLLLTTLSCESEAPPPAPPEAELLPTLEGDVIARVGERTITTAQLQATLDRMPPGTSPQDALQSLIELEVIAQEATRRGLDQRWSVRRHKERAMVQRLLELVVEGAVDEETDFDALVRQVYDEILLDIPGLKPELRTIDHILVILPPDPPPEKLEEAQALAGQIHAKLAALGRSPTPQELDHLAFEAGWRGGRVKAEHDLTFPKRAPDPVAGQPPRFREVVEPFAEAAFALSKEAFLSPPTTTQFGVHVIVWRNTSPAWRAPLETLAPQIEAELRRQKRAAEFEGQLQQLWAHSELAISEEALEIFANHIFGASPPSDAP